MVLDEAKMEYILERKFYSRERSKEPQYIGKNVVEISLFEKKMTDSC